MISFNSIREKVLNDVRINEKEALFLFESPRLFEIGQLADIVNYRKHQDAVFFNKNSHLNPTNVCVMSCKFCSFARKPGQEGAFAYTIEEIMEKADRAIGNGAKELHMVGGLHPRWKLEYYGEMFSTIKAKYPYIHIKGLTAVEIDWLSKKSRKSHAEVLLYLKESGLDSMPGGGAEIFHPDCRDLITAKLSTDKWIDIHRIAHSLGLKTNCTMLYGHVEKFHHRVYHFQKLRQLQDESHGFNCFIPLSFQPHGNEMGRERFTFGADDLKVIAIARIFLDNFQQIKSYWVMLGQDIAQLALHFGANDMDGTVQDEKISDMAGGRSGKGMKLKSIKRLIMKAHKSPLERDTVYNAVEKPSDDVHTLQRNDLSVSELLEKAERGLMLEAEELLLLSEKADLYSLTKTAQKLREQIVNYDKASFHVANHIKIEDESIDFKNSKNCGVLIDLALWKHSKHPLSLKALLELLKKFETEQDLTLLGFRSLWDLGSSEQPSHSDVFKTLFAHGVRSFASSPLESESSLTHREILQLHYAAHSNGILTTAKAEINSPLTDISAIWKSFVERLLAFRELQSTSNGLLAISIEAAEHSWVSAQEYLRAVALARIACPNIDHIQVPLMQMPMSRDVHLLNTQSPIEELRGQEKYAPLLLLAGADDLGNIPEKLSKSPRIYEEILSVGLHAQMRNHKFEILHKNWKEGLEKSPDLRHLPLHQISEDTLEPQVLIQQDAAHISGVSSHATYH